MRKAFILVNKLEDDYSGLKDFDTVFLFTHVPSYADKQIISDHLTLLTMKIDTASPEDVIVFNGPSWLIALAGFVWLNNENRVTMGVLVFNNFHQKYTEIQNDY
jgi:hypothetical protein